MLTIGCVRKRFFAISELKRLPHSFDSPLNKRTTDRNRDRFFRFRRWNSLLLKICKFKNKRFRLLQKAIDRNANRIGKEHIPEIGIRGTYNRLEVPTMDEGFDQLFYVDIYGNDFIVKTETEN